MKPLQQRLVISRKIFKPVSFKWTNQNQRLISDSWVYVRNEILIKSSTTLEKGNETNNKWLIILYFSRFSFFLNLRVYVIKMKTQNYVRGNQKVMWHCPYNYIYWGVISFMLQILNFRLWILDTLEMKMVSNIWWWMETKILETKLI